MYQIGQAIVYDTPYEMGSIAFSLSGETLWTLDGEEVEGTVYPKRPATEAEILAEAERNGWDR